MGFYATDRFYKVYYLKKNSAKKQQILVIFYD